MANYWNSTIRIKPDAKRMKRGGRLRPIRKTAPGTDSRLKQDLTKLVSKYVRLRDPVCIVCEVNKSENAGHLFHRDAPSVEFDLRNVWGSCAPCNLNHEATPQPMHDAVLLRLGEREYADLCELAHNHKVKYTRLELEALYLEISERLREHQMV